MKTNLQPSILHSRKTKGFIFTLDALLATFILILVFVVAHFFSARAAEDKLALLQPLNALSDTITFLDTNGILQTRNQTLIQYHLTTLLPPGFNGRVQIHYSTNEPPIDLGEEIPRGIFIAGGKRYFLIGSDYGIVRYWIWPKE